MAAAIQEVDPVHPITLGLHMEDLEEDRRLGPQEAARACDFLCMHGYPLYAAWADEATDELVLPFLGLITRWLGGRDVLFQEFGAPTAAPGPPPLTQAGKRPVPLLEEEVAAAFTGRALAALHRFGFTGALLWCYGDYAESLWDHPPLEVAVHERTFGLWRADRSAKPALAEISSRPGLERCEGPDDFSWIDIRPDDFYATPGGYLPRLYRRFRERHAARA